MQFLLVLPERRFCNKNIKILMVRIKHLTVKIKGDFMGKAQYAYILKDTLNIYVNLAALH